MTARRSFRRAWFAAGAALLVAACGGGDDGGGGPTPLSITVTQVDDGVVGLAYSSAVVTSGGTGTKSFSVSGTLPDGLALNASTGAISGTPNGPAGESDVTVTVTDSASPMQSDSQAFTIRIADLLTLDATGVPEAVVGVPYNHALSASGGILPYNFAFELPSGLTIDAQGLISGTPTADARTAVGNLLLSDSASPQQFVQAELRLPVDLQVTTTALPDAIGGVSYSAQLQAQGGLPDFDWAMTGGALPLNLNLSGRVSGTPDASCAIESYSFDVSVADSDTPAQVATRQGIELDVVPRAVSISQASAPPVATIGVAYTHQIDVEPGVAPYVFTVTAGSLPPGLSLAAATGILSGTPSTAGTFGFTVTVSDDCGESDASTFTLVVRDTPTGRNDSIATATLAGNGAIIASISPSGHPNTQFSPDEDYYEVRTTATSTITVDLAGLSGGVDTVVELLNAGGGRLQTCGAPLFDDECMNDDRVAGNLDSLLEVRVTGATTFYVHVVEWRGDARPDLRYRLELSGIN